MARSHVPWRFAQSRRSRDGQFSCKAMATPRDGVSWRATKAICNAVLQSARRGPRRKPRFRRGRGGMTFVTRVAADLRERTHDETPQVTATRYPITGRVACSLGRLRDDPPGAGAFSGFRAFPAERERNAPADPDRNRRRSGDSRGRSTASAGRVSGRGRLQVTRPAGSRPSVDLRRWPLHGAGGPGAREGGKAGAREARPGFEASKEEGEEKVGPGGRIVSSLSTAVRSPWPFAFG